MPSCRQGRLGCDLMVEWGRTVEPHLTDTDNISCPINMDLYRNTDIALSTVSCSELLVKRS